MLRSFRRALILASLLVICPRAQSDFTKLPSFGRDANSALRAKLETLETVVRGKSSQFVDSGSSWRSLKRTGSRSIQSRGLDMLRFCAIAGMRGTPALAIAGLLVLHNAAPMTLVILAMGRSGLFLARGLASGPVQFVAGSSRFALGEAAYWASRNSMAGAFRIAATGGSVAVEDVVFGGLASSVILMGQPTDAKRMHVMAEESLPATHNVEGAKTNTASSGGVGLKPSSGVAVDSLGERSGLRRGVWRRRHWWA